MLVAPGKALSSDITGLLCFFGGAFIYWKNPQFL